MNRIFSLVGFERFCVERAVVADTTLAVGVGIMAERIYDSAHGLFGNEEKLQPPLAPSTVKARENDWGYYKRDITAGATNTSTMLWSGSLRDSMQHEQFTAGGVIAAGVGTPDKRLLYLELGTPKIPPRGLLREASLGAKEENWLVVRHFAAEALGAKNIANMFSGFRKGQTVALASAKTP